MATRQKGYGLSREIGNKIAAKYSADDEREIAAWMVACFNHQNPMEHNVSYSGDGSVDFHAWLKDGQILCWLMNCLKSSSIPKKIHDTSSVKMAAMRKNKEMENISFFLTAAEAIGVAKTDLFQTVDLYEAQNMAQVQATLYKLSAVAAKNGYEGPTIGVKIAEKHEREFDEQQLREGRNVIGLQMGTNQVASQKGHTAYGQGRQIAPRTK